VTLLTPSTIVGQNNNGGNTRLLGRATTTTAQFLVAFNAAPQDYPAVGDFQFEYSGIPTSITPNGKTCTITVNFPNTGPIEREVRLATSTIPYAATYNPAIISATNQTYSVKHDGSVAVSAFAPLHLDEDVSITPTIQVTYNQDILGTVNYQINGLPLLGAATTGTGATRTVPAQTLAYETVHNITFTPTTNVTDR